MTNNENNGKISFVCSSQKSRYISLKSVDTRGNVVSRFFSDLPIHMSHLLKVVSNTCYGVGDMCEQKSLLKEGKWPGAILPPEKSISQIGNPSSGWPTPRFYCRGEGVFVVTEY